MEKTYQSRSTKRIWRGGLFKPVSFPLLLEAAQALSFQEPKIYSVPITAREEANAVPAFFVPDAAFNLKRSEPKFF